MRLRRGVTGAAISARAGRRSRSALAIVAVLDRRGRDTVSSTANVDRPWPSDVGQVWVKPSSLRTVIEVGDVAVTIPDWLNTVM